jgi:hypothetical protein
MDATLTPWRSPVQIRPGPFLISYGFTIIRLPRIEDILRIFTFQSSYEIDDYQENLLARGRKITKLEYGILFRNAFKPEYENAWDKLPK